MYTINDFWMDVQNAHSANPYWRYGQTTFNVLAGVRPDLAEQVRGSSFDPFHLDLAVGGKWNRFINFLERNW